MVNNHLAEIIQLSFINNLARRWPLTDIESPFIRVMDGFGPGLAFNPYCTGGLLVIRSGLDKKTACSVFRRSYDSICSLAFIKRHSTT